MKSKSIFVNPLVCLALGFALSSTTYAANPLSYDCTLKDASDPNFLEMVSVDDDGDPHTVLWAKKIESDGKPLYSMKALDEAAGDLQGESYPVLKDGTVVHNRRALSEAEIDQTKTSPAVFACEKQGLHLPTIYEYEALQHCFNTKRRMAHELGVPVIKRKDLASFYRQFPEMKPASYGENKKWWSSTVVWNARGTARDFTCGMFGDTETVYPNVWTNRDEKLSVRCIK